MPSASSLASPAATRDAFLEAFDAGQHAEALALAGYLTHSGIALPSVTCLAFDLPVGSTYAAAARALIDRAAGLGVDSVATA